MEILVISREFPPHVLGGISYHLKYLYNALSNRGHNITVLAGKCPQSYTKLEDEINTDINVETVQFGYRKGYYVLFPAALRIKLQQVDTSMYDIAITHTPLPFEIDSLDLVTKYHDCAIGTREYYRKGLTWLEKIGDSLIHPFRKWIDQTSLIKSKHLIFNSQLNLEAWNDHYDMESDPNIIHNGVDTDVFYPCDRNNNYLLFVGDSERKGLSNVLDYATHASYPIHIVGNVNTSKDGIVVHGRVDQTELRKLYSGAIATIHPTKFEAFGNIVLESLACGTPVITTDQCGAKELLTEETGIITNNLPKAVKKVGSLSEPACVRVAENNTWSTVADQTINVLERVA